MSFWLVLNNLKSQIANLKTTSQNVKLLAEDFMSGVSGLITGVSNAMAGTAENIYLAISNTGKNISNSVDTAISNAGKVLIAWTGNAGNAYRGIAKSAPGIVGDAMLAAGNTAGRFVAFNYKLGSDYAREQEKMKQQIVRTQEEADRDLKSQISKPQFKSQNYSSSKAGSLSPDQF